jgi:hypothetical protein
VLLLKLLALTTLITVCWSLWTLRYSWRHGQFQIGATAMVALGAAALILMAPMTTASLGVFIYQLSGRYGVNLFVAHICAIESCGAAVYHVLIRINDDAPFARKFERYIQYPVRLAVVILIVPFWLSGTTRQYRPSLSDMHVDGWLRCYWVILCVVFIYLLAYAARAYLTVRHDPASRPVALIYLWSAFAGMAASADRLLLVINPDVDISPVNPTLRATSLLSMAGFAYAAGYSWIRRPASGQPSDDLVSQ